MTKNLRLLLAAISFFTVQFSFSQVTLITPSGSEINSGVVLPNGRVTMSSENNNGMYTIDGTSVKLITNLTNGIDPEFIYKGKGYFESDSGKFYVTDGTTGGTQFITQINKTGHAYINNAFKFNNLLYFTADDGVHGYELWSTDGTAANTKLVTDINGDSSGSFHNTFSYEGIPFFVNGSYVLFTAYGADSTFGLYKLTASGVSLLQNNFADSTTLYFDTTGGKTFFSAYSGTVPTGSSQLWVTDGVATSLLYNPGAGVFAGLPDFVNGKFIFFVTDNTTNKSSLWLTDGTAANTNSYKNLNSKAGYGSVVNNKLLFTAPTSNELYELWVTDGTASGTKTLKNNAHLGSGISMVLNNKFIFWVGTDTTGYEFWTTDGTAANTTLLKDIVPGDRGSDPGFVYNTAALQNSYTSGTFSRSTPINYFTPFKGKYYFTANDELWGTDGTTDGTTLITNIDVQNNGSFFYTTTGIYFTEEDEDRSEFGLWVTDGTSAGTTKIDGYGSGNRKSYYLFVYNNQLYFYNYYYDTERDSDLYKINTTVSILPVGLSNFTASLQPSSVLLNWQTAAEINTDHFGVERSVDGVHFNNIGNVAASGTSSTTHNYTLNDYDALHLGSSTLYYRLKTIDKDGKYTYSSIIKLQLHGSEFAYSLSPNPAHSQLTISFTTGNSTKQASLRITNANGKPVYEKSLQGLQAGSVQQYINVAGLASGIYYVQLITGNNTKTLKFVKQ